MAEELGTAVLRLTIDDSDIRTGLERAQKLVNQTSGRIQAQLNRAVSAASGGNFGAQERAYKAALNVSKELLGTDLRRFQLLRQFQQQLARATAARAISAESGFAAFSAAAPGAPRRARNEERRAQQEARRTAQLDALDADLARVREARVASEKRALQAQRQRETSARRAAREERALQDKRTRQQKDILSNALIGGAFPLLFGQGVGAAAGGALGGGLGGKIGGQFGFGLSLIGTAVGAQLDQALTKLGAVGTALNNPIEQFSTLQQNATLSSKAQERYIEGLIASGRAAEASAVIQEDLIETFGSLQAAKAYADEVDELNRAWSRATTVLASFVVGPLAEFLKALTDAGNNFGTAARFEQLVGQLSPEEYVKVDRVRTEATEQARLQRAAQQGGAAGLFTRILPPSEGDVATGRQAGIKEAERLLGLDKQREDIAARIAAAQVLNTQALSTQYKLLDAQTQGYDRQALLLEKQVILNERNKKLLELPEDKRTNSPEALKIQQDAALATYKITQQLSQLDKDRIATAQLQFSQFRAQAIELERQYQASQRIAAIETAPGATVARDTTRTIEDQLARIRQARQAEADLAAQIAAEQIRGGDQAAERINELSNQQITAALTTRNLLFEAATALRDSGKELNRDLRNAISSFTAIRADPQGLNRFLNPEQRGIRAQQDFQLLLPSFRRAQADFFQLTGQRAPDFRGSTQTVNAAIRDFISAVDRERQAGINLVDIQLAIESTNKTLIKANSDLVTVVNRLVDKDWNVQVNVAADGTSQTFGDALTGAVS